MASTVRWQSFILIVITITLPRDVPEKKTFLSLNVTVCFKDTTLKNYSQHELQNLMRYKYFLLTMGSYSIRFKRVLFMPYSYEFYFINKIYFTNEKLLDLDFFSKIDPSL